MKALKDLGVDSYRFSISWTRILPSKNILSLTGLVRNVREDEKNGFKFTIEICYILDLISPN